jgi:hypothetical protein
MLLTIHPIPFINLPIHLSQLALAMPHPILKLPLINTAIHIFHDPLDQHPHLPSSLTKPAINKILLPLPIFQIILEESRIVISVLVGVEAVAVLLVGLPLAFVEEFGVVF